MTTTGLAIDFGTHSLAAVVVTDQASWLVPDPTSGETRWRCAVHWDGERVTVGALAEQRRRLDPTGYAAGSKRGLAQDAAALLGARRFRPFEQVVELLTAVRVQAHRQHGPVSRALVTIPADYVPGDPRRGRMIAAAEAAGFGAVELLGEAVAAVSGPLAGGRLGAGDLVLVYDFGATFEATLIRIGDDFHEVIGHQSIVDWGPLGEAPGAMALDHTTACCRDLLDRLGVNPRAVTAVLPIGGGARVPGLDQALDLGLGIPVRHQDEPELVVVRGAAHWLPRSGSRTVAATVPASAERIVPLAFTFPGGSARLLRWLVEPNELYGEGAALARVRLNSGAVWDLTARTGGVLDQVLLADGAPLASGDWVGLCRVAA